MSSPRKRQATRKQQRRRGRAPARLWLTGGALGLIAAALGVYLLVRNPDQPAGERAVTVPPQPPAKAAAAPRADRSPPAGEPAPVKPKPRFDFYTMLPKLKVFVPEPARETAPAAPAGHGAEIDGQGTYALQVGSFRQLGDANRVKARLALIGIEADIYTVTVNEEQWHRLRVGPYSDLKKLHDITARLRKHHINYMVLKLSG